MKVPAQSDGVSPVPKELPHGGLDVPVILALTVFIKVLKEL
jgi:hypothetical protein